MRCRRGAELCWAALPHGLSGSCSQMGAGAAVLLKASLPFQGQPPLPAETAWACGGNTYMGSLHVTRAPSHCVCWAPRACIPTEKAEVLGIFMTQEVHSSTSAKTLSSQSQKAVCWRGGGTGATVGGRQVSVTGSMPSLREKHPTTARSRD